MDSGDPALVSTFFARRQTALLLAVNRVGGPDGVEHSSLHERDKSHLPPDLVLARVWLVELEGHGVAPIVAEDLKIRGNEKEQ